MSCKGNCRGGGDAPTRAPGVFGASFGIIATAVIFYVYFF